MKEHIIFKAKVGSYAYGTNVEGSDIDYKGVYLQDPEDVLNNGYREQYTINKDETYYELRRFLDLCCTGNPTMLELLYMPEDCIEIIHPVYRELMSYRSKFLSKSCKYSFGGYAYSQITKAQGLKKKMNWEGSKIERKDVLDFCYIYNKNFQVENLKSWLLSNNFKQEFCGLTTLPHFRYMYNLYYNHVKDIALTNTRYSDKESFTFKGIVSNIEKANDISLSEVPEWYRKSCEALMFFNKDEYSRHCKDYLSYQEWLKNRNTQRYIDIANHSQKIDGKNLLHCYRLLDIGIEIAKNHEIIVKRPNAEFLIEIRKGKHNLEKLLTDAELKIKEMDKAYEESTLPTKADRGFFMSLMSKLRKKFYER